MARISRHLTVCAVLALAPVLGGCFFSPREAEPPDAGTSVPYLDRTEPRNVWDNMQTSLRNAHAPGWEDAILQSDFVYLPDGDAASQFPGVFDGWDGEREVAFIRDFYGTAPTIDVQLLDPDFVVPPTSGTDIRWEGVIYDMSVTGQGGAVNRYRGEANITFEVDGNFWYVTLWEDLQGLPPEDAPGGAALPTFGVLRGTISGNR